MKKIDLGQSVGILANVGVLVGILLLVYELGLNRQMMRAQTRHDLAEAIVGQLTLLATDGELAELIARVDSGAANVTEVERGRYQAVVNARFRTWEDVHYQYRADLYDESEFVTQTLAWKRFLDSDATQEIWLSTRDFYSPEFAAQIDALLAE